MKDMIRLTCSCRWGCGPKGFLSWHKFNNLLSNHSFSWAKGLPRIGILGDKGLSSSKILNNWRSRSLHRLGILDYLFGFPNYFTSKEPLLHARNNWELSYRRRHLYLQKKGKKGGTIGYPTVGMYKKKKKKRRRRRRRRRRQVEKEERREGKYHTTSLPEEGLVAALRSDLCLDYKDRNHSSIKEKGRRNVVEQQTMK